MDGRRMIQMPFVELRPWHRWFAWHPVKLEGTAGRVWLRYVERRHVWFVYPFSEYRLPLTKETEDA